MKKQKKIIGILGGMGPQASVKLVTLIVEKSAKKFRAKNCEDFPEIILDSIPLPDFIADHKNQDLALKMLKNRIKNLDKMNISVFCLACNTAHLLLDTLQAVTKIPFISIVDEVKKIVIKKKLRRVGLLASPVTISSGLYENVFKKEKIEIILPTKSQQNVLEQIIRRIIAGQNSKTDKSKLENIAKSLHKKDAEGIILGCTELPLIFPQKFNVPVINSLEVLADRLLAKSFKKGGGEYV